VLLHGRRPPLRRALLAAGAGALVGGVAGGSAIGFYLRNRSLYGSLTGAAYNQQLFRFKPQDHVLELLRSQAYGLRLYDGLWTWTRFNLPRVPVPPVLVAVPRVLALAAVAGLAVGAARGLRALHRPAGGDLAAAAAWTLAVGWGVGVYVMVASYDGHGGHTHPRYLFPGLAVLAVAAALGLDRLPGAGRGLWIWGATLAQLTLTGVAWASFVTALRGRRPGSPADLAGAVAGLLGAGGVRWPWVVLTVAALLLAVALALLGRALDRIRPQPPGRGIGQGTLGERSETALGGGQPVRHAASGQVVATLPSRVDGQEPGGPPCATSSATPMPAARSDGVAPISCVPCRRSAIARPSACWPGLAAIRSPAS
jgi:hypothetical protein